MKRVKQIIVSWILFTPMSLVPALAQEGWEEGQLDPVEIEIVKERQITLPKASRKFEQVPPQPKSAPIKAPVEYDFRSLSFQTPLANPSLRPLRIREEKAEKIRGGHITAGYGNYASPYFDAFVNTRRNKQAFAGVHAWYDASGKGPVDGENSGSGDGGVSLFGKTFTKDISASGELDFQNRFTRFYGYAPGTVPEGSAERQSYNTFRVAAGLSNAKNKSFAYDLGASFAYLSDRFEAQESDLGLDLRLSYSVNEKSSASLRAGYSLLSRSDEAGDFGARHLFSASPTYVFYPVENLRISAGMIFSYENDTINTKDIHLYPDFRASYPLSPSVEVIGALTGGIEKVSLRSMSEENLWLDANIPVFHTNKLYDFQVGLNARIGNKVSLNGGFSLAALKNWYNYVNTFDDPSRFAPEFDVDAVTRGNFFASFGFVQQKAAKFLLRGDVYAYDRKVDESVWHRPLYRVTGDFIFNIYDKLLFDVTMIAQGGMKAKRYTSPGVFEEVQLDAALDLNSRLEYVVSESVSTFVQANNILGQEYPLFLNYPVRGLQFMGGLTVRF